MELTELSRELIQFILARKPIIRDYYYLLYFHE